MSQPYTPKIAPARAADISAAWIAQVRDILLRDGQACRGGFPDIVIEVQAINTGEWQALNLPTNTIHFATDADRDAVLAMLQGERPISS